MHYLRSLALALLLLIASAAAASAYIGIKHYYNDLSFRHYVHTEGQGIACVDCHQKIKNGVYRLPDHEVCVSCHAPLIDTDELSATTCGVCHPSAVAKDGAMIITLKPQHPRGNVFRHSDALLNLCHNCHGAMLDEIVKVGKVRTPEEKARIRELSHRFYFAAECGKCHVDMSRDKPPANHVGNWARDHAAAAPAFNCRICHSKTFCQDCHEYSY
ncbi:MAG: cytochrome c3 family protein [Thermodesulfobacteriota bacterium]